MNPHSFAIKPYKGEAAGLKLFVQDYSCFNGGRKFRKQLLQTYFRFQLE